MMLTDADDFEEFELQLIHAARDHHAKMRGFTKAQRRDAIRQIAASADCIVAVVPRDGAFEFIVVRGELPDGTTASSANAFMASEKLALEIRRGFMN
jgi:hypothetical protein